MAFTYVARIWIDDRPGALGQVASRIGALQGDVVGIEILERGAGRAVDELVIELPDATRVDRLIREINEVDGAAVEEVRPLDGPTDSGLDALESAAHLVGTTNATDLFEELVVQVQRSVGGGWAAVVDLHDARVHAWHGSIPPVRWLVAFVAGSQHAARLHPATEEAVPAHDVVWAPLVVAGVALVVGRDQGGIRAKQRHRVAALARIADAWVGALRASGEMHGSRSMHPSSNPPPVALSVSSPEPTPTPTPTTQPTPLRPRSAARLRLAAVIDQDSSG
ncbi:MAG: ACT domain-containing protein [Acidimicrobiales bacterium]